MVLLAQMKQLLSLKTQQHFSVFGTCFDVSDMTMDQPSWIYSKDLQNGRSIKQLIYNETL